MLFRSLRKDSETNSVSYHFHFAAMESALQQSKLDFPPFPQKSNAWKKWMMDCRKACITASVPFQLNTGTNFLQNLLFWPFLKNLDLSHKDIDRLFKMHRRIQNSKTSSHEDIVRLFTMLKRMLNDKTSQAYGTKGIKSDFS